MMPQGPTRRTGRWVGVAVALVVLCGGSGAPARAATDLAGIKDAVAFLFTGDEARLVPHGTAFFVSPDDERGAPAWLVTARHLLVTPEGAPIPSVYARLNQRAGGIRMIRIPMAGPEAVPVQGHPDLAVDLAVIPVRFPVDDLDVRGIPIRRILTKDAAAGGLLREGGPVFFTGLFAGFVGTQRNHPLVRSGTVALLPREPIPLNGRMRDLYLIESKAFGGSSGSPVFVETPTGPLLAGIVMGYFHQFNPVVSSDQIPASAAMEHLGITGIVPAYRLLELLASDRARP
jgi:hypothetical protein